MLHKKENSIETIGIYNIYGTKVPKRLVWKTIKLFHVDFFKNFTVFWCFQGMEEECIGKEH